MGKWWFGQFWVWCDSEQRSNYFSGREGRGWISKIGVDPGFWTSPM